MLPQFKEKVLGNRKIGLGITGFANLLIKLGIKYDSQECLDFIDKLFGFKKKTEEKYNKELALEKGNFPNWEDSIYAKTNTPRRNATISTQAPTGSITTILGTEAYGIEPIFNIGYIRRIVEGEILEVNQLFKEKLHKEIDNSIEEEKIIKECINKGTTNISIVPKELKNLFRCANDISPEWHIKTMAQIQRYYDNAISKTINLPESATREDVKNAYIMAFNFNCKGVTVYRNNSRQNQTIQIGNNKNKLGIQFDTLIPIKRSTMGKTYGTTVRKRSACGKMYITINRDKKGNIVESFVNVGKNGICKSNIDGINRLISLGLRSGIKVEEIIDQLKGINCPACTKVIGKGQKIDGISCPDVIARTLKEEYENNKTVKPEKIIINKCPECGAKLKLTEGCYSCIECGWSRCN